MIEFHSPYQSTKRGTVALTFDYKVRDRLASWSEGQLEGDSMALVVRRAPRDGLHAHLGDAQGKVISRRR